MSQRKESQPTDDRAGAHFTTRRSFVTTCGLGGLSLYVLWAAYGAAPTSLDFLTPVEGGGKKDAKGMTGMGGMGGGKGDAKDMGGGNAPTTEEFELRAEKFLDANRLADDSIKVSRNGPRSPGPTGGEKAGGEDEPVDVYILARRFGYQPEVLRLERGVPYRFLIMPMDADHGASIGFGRGSRIIRGRAGVVSEVELSFREKGELFMYCTVYCGDGHDKMRSKIIVT